MRQQAAEARQPWALGDYHAFAKATIWEIGPLLIRACGVAPGQHVLDVAAGTGNTAIRAAQAGARVIASDLATENFEAGRREAAELGVSLEWQEADAQALPFDDEAFDVITSSFGAIFAPNHHAVANEMVRVCRPGGTIGFTAFRPTGVGAEFFTLFGRYAPPLPPDALPPLLWGDEDHVRSLFGDRVEWIELGRRSYVERSASGPEAYAEFFMDTFGPLIALRDGLAAEDPERAAALEDDFLGFARRMNRGAGGGPAEYSYDYLLAVARKRNR